MKISTTQIEVLRRMAADTTGSIQREPGGYWAPPGLDKDQRKRRGWIPSWSVDVRTVRALERMGFVERTGFLDDEWRDQRRITEIGRRMVRGH